MSANPETSTSRSRNRSPLPLASTEPVSSGTGASASIRSSHVTQPRNFDDFINYADIQRICIDEESSIKFCQKHGLIPRWIDCPTCGDRLDKIHYVKQKNKTINACIFRCSKRTCRFRKSIFYKTWFEGRHISVHKCISLTYLFLMRQSINQAIIETSGLSFGNPPQLTSSETVVDTYSYCMEVMEDSSFEASGG